MDSDEGIENVELQIALAMTRDFDTNLGLFSFAPNGEAISEAGHANSLGRHQGNARYGYCAAMSVWHR